MPWYCGNCGEQGPYYRSDGPPSWCTKCGARKEEWRYQINPPVHVKGAPGIPGDYYDSHPRDAADAIRAEEQRQLGRERTKDWLLDPRKD